MTEQINAYRQIFQDSVELALQQTKPHLAGLMMAGSHAGGEKTRLILRAGSKNTTARTERGSPMEFGDISLQQRWITGSTWQIIPDLVDSLDKVRMGVDPSSWIVQSHAAGIVRHIDQRIINAFFSTAKIGDDGNSTASFDANNSIAANSTGMTVAKLRQARTILLKNHVDVTREQPYIAMEPQQLDDLLADIQTTSKDFNGGTAPLVDGNLSRFVGFNIVVIASDETNGFGLPVDGSSNRRCPFWVKSGMHYGTWQAPQTSIDQRVDLQGKPYQLYSMGDDGATRLDEGKVGEILCAE